MVVLGIETSCDETAASIIDSSGIRSDVVYTQQVHAAFGGVVPELAARAHTEKIRIVVEEALRRAELTRPDAVAATAGPGLIGAVLVGLSFGKALAAGWGVPFVGVNHLEGHLLSALLEDPAPSFPFLALVVSGGHTTLYLAKSLGNYEVIAATVDDAAGEAFDKVARMMGLGYPGGPVVDRLAAQGKSTVRFPRPRAPDLDWSFSGLKTAVRQHLQQPDCAAEADVCASFQEAVVDVLLDRVRRAAKRTGVTQLAIAGGVGANSALRARAVAELNLEVFLPARHRCTDNGAMIANVGRLYLQSGRADPLDFGAKAGWQPA